MSRPAICSLLVVAFTLAAAPTSDIEALLREGNMAFQRGDFATAVASYERAGLRTTEPSLVAFSLAAVKYRQALDNPEGRAKGLEEAEQYFRCCLSPIDPRRGRALDYLGACLLHQALDGQSSRAHEAAGLLEKCLLEPGLDERTIAEARHNLALARLLAAQTPPPPPASQRSDEPPDGEQRNDSKSKEPPRATEVGPKPNGDPAGVRPDPRGTTGDAKYDLGRTGADPRSTNPGRERMFHNPDGDETFPADVRNLKEAFERILAEQQTYKRKKMTPPAPGVKDW